MDGLSVLQVKLAQQYLHRNGVMYQNIDIHRQALLVCQSLWLDMANIGPLEDPVSDVRSILELRSAVGVGLHIQLYFSS